MTEATSLSNLRVYLSATFAFRASVSIRDRRLQGPAARAAGALSAREGTRTLTVARRILNPLRLPVPPPARASNRCQPSPLQRG